MYGLVNKAVEGMVCSKFGEASWARIKRAAEVDVDVFISMDAYDDAVTYRLVDAASKELGMPAASVLEAFGEYWVMYTATEGYGEVLKMSGATLAEFLMNLDNLHARVGLSFPELRPPTFWTTDVADGSLQLHYRSERSGLAPMVVGLLRGVGSMFATSLEVEHAERLDDGADHDVFLVTYKAK